MTTLTDHLRQPHFQPPHSSLTLASDEVHIWQVDLTHAEQHAALLNLLSNDEKARAKRFRFDQHRNRYIVARAALRKILALYLDYDPKQLQFHYAEHGKPLLIQKFHDQALQFNLSHSADLAVYAFTVQHPIGIDVEHIRTNLAIEKLAARFFSSNESKALQQLPETEKLLGFFYTWTRKEAFLKALGAGLSFPLNQFEISLDPQTHQAIQHIQDDSHPAASWFLQSFFAAPHYIAAIAMEKKIEKVQYWHLPLT